MNDLEKTQSCITQITQQEPNLTGENVIVAVLDSGIDYFLPEFRNAEGQNTHSQQSGIRHSSQTRRGENCLRRGTFRRVCCIQEEMINGHWLWDVRTVKSWCPLQLSGHGTAVAGVAAGTSMGLRPRRICWWSGSRQPQAGSFPRTTQLMRGRELCRQSGRVSKQTSGSQHQFWQHVWRPSGQFTAGTLY